jgi:hypothetical protein
LIERLNAFLGSRRITRIKLETGNISARPESPEHPTLRPQQPDEPKTATGLKSALAKFAALRARLGLKLVRPNRPD